MKNRSTFRAKKPGNAINIAYFARKGWNATIKRFKWLADKKRKRSPSELATMERAAYERQRKSAARFKTYSRGQANYYFANGGLV